MYILSPKTARYIHCGPQKPVGPEEIFYFEISFSFHWNSLSEKTELLKRDGGQSNRTNETAGCTLQGQTMPMTRETGMAFWGMVPCRVVQKVLTLLQKATWHESTRRHSPQDRTLYNYRRYSLKPLGRSKVTVLWVISVHSSVTIVTALRAACSSNSGSKPGSGKTFIPSPKRPHRLWGPPRQLGYRSSFRGSKRAGAWTWPFTSHLEPSLRIKGAISPLPKTSASCGEEHFYRHETLTENAQDN